MQYKRLLANLDRVARVVTTLVTNNNFELLRKQINDLALTFIAPLGANYCDYFCHSFGLPNLVSVFGLRPWFTWACKILQGLTSKAKTKAIRPEANTRGFQLALPNLTGFSIK